jgi:hypothetical protein
MYGYFAIRRLMECMKLSDDTLALSVPLTQYPALPGSRITAINWNQLEKHYDLESPSKTSLPLRELTNQLIHSYVFVIVVGPKRRLTGALVSSEYRRRRSLLYLPARKSGQLFRRVAADSPDEVHLTFDVSIGDYRYSARRSAQ